jgi:hypothetical protein
MRGRLYDSSRSPNSASDIIGIVVSVGIVISIIKVILALLVLVDIILIAIVNAALAPQIAAFTERRVLAMASRRNPIASGEARAIAKHRAEQSAADHARRCCGSRAEE